MERLILNIHANWGQILDVPLWMPLNPFPSDFTLVIIPDDMPSKVVDMNNVCQTIVNVFGCMPKEFEIMNFAKVQL